MTPAEQRTERIGSYQSRPVWKEGKLVRLLKTLLREMAQVHWYFALFAS